MINIKLLHETADFTTNRIIAECWKVASVLPAAKERYSEEARDA